MLIRFARCEKTKACTGADNALLNLNVGRLGNVDAVCVWTCFRGIEVYVGYFNVVAGR